MPIENELRKQRKFFRTESVRHFRFFSMVIFLQYTFTDLRSFTDFRASLLIKPAWPNPTPFKEFFRGTGQIVERKKYGIEGWVGENFICKIRHSIRFSTFENETILIKNVGKHFYASEDFVLSKYE